MMAEKEKLQALGLEYDPAKFPHMLPKDDDLANYHRYRTEANDTYDELKKENRYDPEAEERIGVKAPDVSEEMRTLLNNHRNRYKRENKDNEFDDMIYINENEMYHDVQDLDREMLVGKHGKLERQDWFDWLKDPKATTEEVADKFD